MHLVFLTELFAGKLVHAFCWMLLHSLWQGLIFTIAAGMVMLLTTRASASLRYNLLSALFFLFILTCGFTFIRGLNLDYSSNVTLSLSGAYGSDNSGPVLLQKFIDLASSHAAIIVAIWFIIFCVKAAKTITAFAYNHYLKKHTIPISNPFWIERISKLAEQIQVKKTVLFFESEIVKVPVVLGHLKPIIFIPIGLLTNLPAGEAEAVLLHELAHVHRNDYIVNMMQVIAETVFFFNPALLWISDIVKQEREHCCDDIAVAQSKSKRQFIQALISFKESSLISNRYRVAFPGSKNQLLKRVSRIAYGRNSALDRVGKTFVVGSVLSLALIWIAASKSSRMLAEPKTVKKEASFIKPIVIDKTVSLQRKIPDARIKPDIENKNIAYRKDLGIEHKYLPVKKLFTISKSSVSEVNHRGVQDESGENSGTDEAQIARLMNTERLYNEQVEVYRQQAQRFRLQAEKDREQAAYDRRQAELDRMQAQKDRKRAMEDMKQAERDRQQTLKDRQQAENERLFHEETNIRD